MAFQKKTISTKAAAPAPSVPATPQLPPSVSTTQAAPAPRVEISDEEFLLRVPAHTCCIYGDSGTGKSTLAAKYPKTAARPQLVMAFDPPSKAHPYKAGLTVQAVSDPFYDQQGILVEDCYNEAGEMVRRVEHYIDPDVEQPRAVANVEARLAGFYNEAANWSSVVFDSMSFYQYGSLRRAKYLNPIPEAKAAQQQTNLTWYNSVKEDVNRLIRSQAVWWPTTTIFIFHTSEDKAEFASETVRGILAVGKLPGELPSGFSEMYHMSVKRSGDQYIHLAKTKHDGLWAATSIIARAPSPCEPDFRVLWANYLTPPAK